MKVLKVRLVAEWVSGSADEWLDSTPAPVPSCATCKWAEATRRTTSFPNDGRMWCARASTEGSSARVFGAAHHHPDTGEVTEWRSDARLMVGPEHGCVQWEGK